MRKVFTLMMAMMLCVISAQAVSVTINIDNPEAITVSHKPMFGGDITQVEMTAGENTFEVQTYSSLTITATENWIIGEITGSSNVIMPGDGKEYATNIWSSAVSYTISTVQESEFKNATFTLKYDDAAQIKAVLGGTNEVIALDEDANEVSVSFSSKFENTLTLSNPIGKKLYQVTANGEAVAISGNSVKVNLTPDMVVEVESEYPDIKVPVHFVFSNPGTEGFLTSVTVDGDEVQSTVYLSDNYKVQLGSKIVLSGNSDDYEINSTTVNDAGFSFNYYDEYTYQVMEETTFTFDVTAYATFQKKIIVEGAEYFTLYKGYSWDGDVIDLNEGENTVEFVSNDLQVAIDIDPDYYFETLTDDGEDCTKYLSKYRDYFDISTEGDLVITVKRINKDKKFVMFIDDIDKTNNFSLQNENQQKYALNTGYNVIDFYDGDGEEWYCNWAQTNGYNQMFINDIEHDGYYGIANMHYFEPQNNDVIRVYLGETPDKVNVNFNVEEGLNIDVKRDILTPVTDLVTPLEVFPDTRFNVSASGASLKVKVGDEPEFTSTSPEFVVTKPTTVTISKDTSVGIESISSESTTENVVYTLQGVKVAGKADIKKLPKGIYIVNGKKISK